MSTTTYTIADRTGTYEMHAAGCTAAKGRTFQIDGTDPAAAAADFAAGNDGCWIGKVHSCVGASKATKQAVADVAVWAADR